MLVKCQKHCKDIEPAPAFGDLQYSSWIFGFSYQRPGVTKCKYSLSPSPRHILASHSVPTHTTRSPARCCDKTGFTTYDYPGSPGNAVQTAGHRIYNPDNVDCEVADVTTDGAASQSRRQLQSDEPYLMSEAIDQLVEEFGGEDKILASIPYE